MDLFKNQMKKQSLGSHRYKNLDQNQKKCLKQFKKAFHILWQLKNLGVKEFCLCPGSRNAPFTYLLSNSSLYKVYSCFEERSAAFFALGRMQKTQLPVAVSTTSGTAVAELLPAVIEAYYLGLPLILVTADRPKSYRKSGAPQSIEQKNIFSDYVCKKFDLEEDSEFDLEGILPRAPLHINVCFDEPLGDFSPKEILRMAKGFLKLEKQEEEKRKEKIPVEKASIERIFEKEKEKSRDTKGRLGKKVRPFSSLGFEFDHKKIFELQVMRKKLKRFFKKHKNPLILLGALNERYQPSLKKFLGSAFFPLYLEPLSGLREDQKLLGRTLTSWEKIFKTPIFHQSIDSILRIGGIPTLRFWRDLEQKYSYPVLNISHLPFKGLGRLNDFPLSLEDFCLLIGQDPFFVEDILKPSLGKDFDGRDFRERRNPLLLEEDRKIREKLNALIERFSFSEPSLVSLFSLMAENQSFIFLGNSLPIREWDLASVRKKKFFYGSQKGANGIDGLISNFLGFCSQKKENWCFIGDLSALYDLNSLWLLKQVSKTRIRIVVVNNGGGRIFSRNFKNSYFFENRHKFSFSHWAKMFSCGYIKISPKLQTLRKVKSLISSKLKKFKDSPVIIEVLPSEKETSQFWKEFDKI